MVFMFEVKYGVTLQARYLLVSYRASTCMYIDNDSHTRMLLEMLGTVCFKLVCE